MARQSGGTTRPGSDDQAKVGEGDRVTHIVGSAGMQQQTDDKATRDQQGYSFLEFTHKLQTGSFKSGHEARTRSGMDSSVLWRQA